MINRSTPTDRIRVVSTLLLACLLSACAFPASERQTLADISSREPILFEQRARWGYTPDGHRGIARGIIVWEGTGDLVLTPTTLYLLHGNRMSRTISYAAVVAAEAGPVQDWAHPPFGAPTTLENVLIVKTVDDVFRFYGRTDDCDEGCVFRLIDTDKARGTSGVLRPESGITDNEAVNRALKIINEHRGQVDAFGRLDGERRAGLVTRLHPRQANWIWWRDKGSEKGRLDPAVEKQIDERLRWLSPSLSDGFDRDAQAALEAAFREGGPGQGFTFLPLEPAEPHRDGRWLGYKEAETLSRTRPDLNRLLLVELIQMHFYPRNMAVHDSEPVEAKYRIHVDFFDLHPPQTRYQLLVRAYRDAAITRLAGGR